jgi:hypothetical protein
MQEAHYFHRLLGLRGVPASEKLGHKLSFIAFCEIDGPYHFPSQWNIGYFDAVVFSEDS